MLHKKTLTNCSCQKNGVHFVVGFIEAVRKRGRSGLIDHTQDVQTRNLARVLRRLHMGESCGRNMTHCAYLTLAVVEVGGHGNHRILRTCAQVRLGGLFHFH